jgi:acyl CoA:acetate/3-ketoacid CoA transferase alpha subunit/acyl CoA:acetate/3-ketoacid CoA transferase beta subunit
MPEIQGKILNLRDAVERYVKPGMQVHLAGGIGGPSAAICEIIRRFRGKNPGFTLVQSTVTGHGLNLVHTGLVKRLVCSVCAQISGSGRPSRVIQEARERQRIEMENWTLNSLQQRLMAGAFGLPFMPTRSVSGSGMASENETAFRSIEDPFGSGKSIGLAGALVPDISIVHGCAADPDGNVIMAAPYGEDIWGALASRGGVVVTVEKIVSTEVIRKYAALVKIPSCAVRAVAEAPFGLHPFSLANPGMDGIEPYEKDVGFLDTLYEASRNDHALDEWIAEWVLQSEDHAGYLAKLGNRRTAELKEKASGTQSAAAETSDDLSLEFKPGEMMLIALAREIENSVGSRGHKVVLAGAGLAATAAFFAYFRLGGSAFELATGNGQIGYTPVAGESILASEANVRTSKMLTDTVMMQGVIVGGENNRCLSILGAGQTDRYGNINSTTTAEGRFLVGSGGVNDALNAREAILCLKQTKERFVDRLPYVTGRGASVTTVVSTMGIFRKPVPGDELHLFACFPDASGRSLEERVQEVRANCGWDLKTAPIVEEIARPSLEELQLLRRLV